MNVVKLKEKLKVLSNVFISLVEYLFNFIFNFFFVINEGEFNNFIIVSVLNVVIKEVGI